MVGQGVTRPVGPLITLECCLDVTFGLRGAALAVLIFPAESKESPFPTANQTCGIWKSLRHNKQGILGCFKCVPVWISA